MPRAVWNHRIIAEAEAAAVRRVEGNIYFPPAAVRFEFLRPSETHTTCAWKGQASYFDVAVDGEIVRDAAWFYARPLEAAASLRDYVAFWRGVSVEE